MAAWCPKQPVTFHPSTSHIPICCTRTLSCPTTSPICDRWPTTVRCTANTIHQPHLCRHPKTWAHRDCHPLRRDHHRPVHPRRRTAFQWKWIRRLRLARIMNSPMTIPMMSTSMWSNRRLCQFCGRSWAIRLSAFPTQRYRTNPSSQRVNGASWKHHRHGNPSIYQRSLGHGHPKQS